MTAAAVFTLVVFVDGAAVAILDAVDQRRLNATPAKHRIGRGHAQRRGLARTERERDCAACRHAAYRGICQALRRLRRPAALQSIPKRSCNE